MGKGPGRETRSHLQKYIFDCRSRPLGCRGDDGEQVASYVQVFRLDGLVVMARVPHPIPFRTRP